MSISREVLAKYIKPRTMFIECGSRWGDTLIRAMELGADSAWGCEADPLWRGIAEQHTKEAWRGPGSIIISLLDSVEMLKCHEKGQYKRPVVVFLDAHTETYSPILEELSALSRWVTKPSVILIDDMRLMEHWGYSAELIEKKVRTIGNYTFEREAGVVPEDILACKLVQPLPAQQ